MSRVRKRDNDSTPDEASSTSRPKRTKLSSPSTHAPGPQESSVTTRPKRNIRQPSRYVETSPPAASKRAINSATANEQSPGQAQVENAASDHPGVNTPVTKRPSLTIKIKLSSRSTSSTDSPASGQPNTEGYSQEFLDHYIVDSPLASSKSAKASAAASTTGAASPIEPAPSSAANAPRTVVEDEESMRCKLSAVINALTGNPHDLIQLTSSSSEDIPMSLNRGSRASGSTTTTDLTSTSSSPRRGTFDENLHATIKRVLDLLHEQVDQKTTLLINASAKKRQSVEHQRLQASVESLKHNILAFELIRASEALNYNCVIPSARMELIVIFYSTLQKIISELTENGRIAAVENGPAESTETPTEYSDPRPAQSTLPSYATTTVNAAAADAADYARQGGNGPAPPHRFVLGGVTGPINEATRRPKQPPAGAAKIQKRIKNAKSER
ncbi:hypothetical protein ANO11243_063910 [Dothideomycetidae sp. 11243]|nr:hypothetical protein ANO11243_063910 [fungal sp. No.11243]